MIWYYINDIISSNVCVIQATGRSEFKDSLGQSFSDPTISSDSDSDWSPKNGLGLKKSWLSYTLTQNYQSVNRLFLEKTLSFIWYVFSTSSAFSVVLKILWYKYKHFNILWQTNKHAESETEGLSKSEIFGLGLQRSPRTRTRARTRTSEKL
jgi:hypothetical protein